MDHVTCKHCGASDAHYSDQCPTPVRSGANSPHPDPCPIVPGAVPVGTAVSYEADGPVNWCWCSRCKAVLRTL